ncbi:hypothetical protein SeMB42_g03786 [Synchytrium endobioticum]|uniref:threonine synthase n=1 Tax=Synchytrium endobioticum TaxID=286115 RepID=A0A507D442_9FUNG|nr:hypothetical protein SeMB42_g03786 [Synchytrium endobioticum]TPX48331.1 hypothetical protein SeLEV6574_g02086 [Synchytrium endobioticum]
MPKLYIRNIPSRLPHCPSPVICTMRFKSTRSSDPNTPTISFEAAVFQGLAPDGGLYIPDTIPQLSLHQILAWQHNSFPEVAFNILSLYIAPEEIPPPDLRAILRKSFSSFSHPDVVPLVKLPPIAHPNLDEDERMYALELFHGPTFAFKDVALQVLGNLFEYFLLRKTSRCSTSGKKSPPHITVLGATSGDTGGAAIYGLRGKANVQLIILHPHNRVSPIQELQMTTVQDANVHNIAVQGTFDDCQEIVKNILGDVHFKDKHHLAAINSINIARILAQIIYYFTSYLSLLKHMGISLDPCGNIPSGQKLPRVQFSVPTGNFGDILAGYYALRMGLPIHRLIIATNENDILTRFFESGTYARLIPNQPTASSQVRQTLSPAMDILVSSNFERLLYYLARGDAASSVTTASPSAAQDSAAARTVADWMSQLKHHGSFSASADVLELAKKTFHAVRASNSQTADIMNMYYNCQHVPYLLDPHSAVGVHAAWAIKAADNSDAHRHDEVYTICLAPAHPGKFPETVEEAINGRGTGKKAYFDDFAPKPLKHLRGLEKRMVVIKTGGLGHIAVSKGTLQVRAIVEKVAMSQPLQSFATSSI